VAALITGRPAIARRTTHLQHADDRARLRLDGGAKLIDYQVLGEGQERDANLSVKVKLTLQGNKGKDVEKTCTTWLHQPSVTVFRDMLSVD